MPEVVVDEDDAAAAEAEAVIEGSLESFVEEVGTVAEAFAEAEEEASDAEARAFGWRSGDEWWPFFFWCPDWESGII